MHDAADDSPQLFGDDVTTCFGKCVLLEAGDDARRRPRAPDRRQGVVIRLKAAPASNGVGAKVTADAE